MEETKRSTFALTVIGLIVAVIGIVVPIAWDYLKNSSALELKETGRTVLVQTSNGLDKLEILYGGKRVNRVLLIRFNLANIGHKAISAAQVLVPPTIQFTNNSDLLDAKIDASFPRNLEPNLTVKNESRQISMASPLMNPGDNVQFSVLIAGVDEAAYTASARIENISELKVTKVAQERKARGLVSWSLIPITFVSVVCWALGYTALSRIGGYAKQRIMFLASDVDRKDFTAGWARYIISSFRWIPREEFRNAGMIIEGLEPSQKMDELQTDAFLREAKTVVKAARPNPYWAVAVMVLALIGLLYVMLQIVAFVLAP